MVRQSTQPMSFNRSTRTDRRVLQTSGRAGKVLLLDYIPVLRGDAVGGEIEVELTLADMPKPLLNGVMCNIQSWFVPKSHFPQFGSWEEFVASYNKDPLPGFPTGTRAAPAFFHGALGLGPAMQSSDHYTTMGLYASTVGQVNVDLLDAYTLIHNFRLRAHSSKLALRAFWAQATNNQNHPALKFARAFWPQNRFSRVVPDYEEALIAGDFNADVVAGTLELDGIYAQKSTPTGAAMNVTGANTGLRGAPDTLGDPGDFSVDIGSASDHVRIYFDASGRGKLGVTPNAGSNFKLRLQDLDKARLAVAMAKRRQAMAGQNHTGFQPENTIMSELMAGFHVPAQMLSRPILLGSRMVPFGFVERFSSDADALEASLTRGATRVRLPVNLPMQESGGYIMTICEIVPERIYERQQDPYLNIVDPAEFPDAEKDVLRTVPVDVVQNRRIDNAHTTPLGVFGYEGMNDVWNRDFTCLGGVFRQPTPGNPSWTEARSSLWVPNIVNPTYSIDHFLVPEDFPHNVFSDTTGPAAEIIVRRNASINGITQIGDPLAEDNADYAAVTAEE